MGAEQDASQNGKKFVAVFFLGAIVLLGGGYLVLSWFQGSGSGKQTVVNLNSATNGGHGTVTETPRYRELLRADNDRGAKEAARNKKTFIASLPKGLDTHDNTPPESPPQKEVKAPEKKQENKQADASKEREKRQQRLQKLLTRIRNNDTATSPAVMATAMWGRKESTASESKNAVQNVNVTTSSATSSQAPGIQLIPALTRVPGYIETAINSDNVSSQVVGIIPAGKWAGARLHSSGVKLAGDGVEVHFTKMSWNGMELNVNAYAQQEKTLQSSVSSDVNNRWVSRIVLPAILSGIGDVGSLYKDANTEVMQGDYGSVTGRVGMPDTETVAGVIAGGMAEKGAEVLSQDAARLPVKQVTVSPGEVISILFVNAVNSNDTVDKNTGTGPSSASPSVQQQTEQRLQAAIERRQTEMRRRYDTNDSE
ncbi:conjugal transfer protein TraO [Salmonella enterica]|nr:conjugal transfer protein TraO [Salmonella enterica]